MNNLEEIKRRYLEDPLPIRLGGLAANLARISSTAKNAANVGAAKSLIEESKYFIEWTACESNPQTTAELVQLQIDLAVLQRTLEAKWNDDKARIQIGLQAKEWSQNVLNSSGLI
jgi:hypothetical protein